MNLYTKNIDDNIYMEKLKRAKRYDNIVNLLKIIGCFNEEVELYIDSELYVIDNKKVKYSFDIISTDLKNDCIIQEYNNIKTIYKFKRENDKLEIYSYKTTYKTDKYVFSIYWINGDYIYTFLNDKCNLVINIDSLLSNKELIALTSELNKKIINNSEELYELLKSINKTSNIEINTCKILKKQGKRQQ